MKKYILFVLFFNLVFFANAQDGSVDLTFNPGTGANNSVLKTAIQTDGKIIIVGEFTTFNGVSRSKIARLNSDGSLDASFNPGTGANSRILTLAIQNDGKIIISGYFTNYNGTDINRIARLNIDGTLDGSFNVGTGTGLVNVIKILSDGKILIGGGFSSYNGTPISNIARLNSDGTLDTSFNIGSGANNEILTISIQSNNKIIIGGRFTSFNNVTRNYLARLNSDGSLDSTFDPVAGTNGYPVLATAIQADGKILIGGAFMTYNSYIGSPRIFRLNPDATIDYSFIQGGFTTFVRDIVVLSDGKILVSGSFYSFDTVTSPVSINRIAKLNQNGTLDTSFNPGIGPIEPGFPASQDIFTTAIQSDGKIIVGGPFTIFNTTGRNRIARLNATSTLDNYQLLLRKNKVIIYSESNILHIESPNNDIKSIQIFDISGKQIYENKIVNNSHLIIDGLKVKENILIFKIIDKSNVVHNEKIIY
jgi:uncharacterized delta-60 repeat protein